jgi:hypothetical protein
LNGPEMGVRSFPTSPSVSTSMGSIGLTATSSDESLPRSSYCGASPRATRSIRRKSQICGIFSDGERRKGRNALQRG